MEDRPHYQTTGAVTGPSNETHFRVWAPFSNEVTVDINGMVHQLDKQGGGYFGRSISGVGGGDTYRFRMENGAWFPDPASRFQPEGVHGPSEIIDRDLYHWNDQDWDGVERKDLIIYEIHVGTFTPEGTFLSAIDRLDELIDLGVNTLEIMPVAQSPGRWNWGYDAVNLFAPSNCYGRPDEFKKLVDVCHQKGLAVILDVVYNHIGPEGNYMANFGPWFSKSHGTPWGEAFNFDESHSSEVRRYIRDNVSYWIEDFHLDGLRLDAIRLMADDSPVSIIEDIARDVDDMRESCKRSLHLIGETCVYDPGLIETGYDGVWSDEIPHAVLSLVLDQREVARRVYRGIDDLCRSLEKGYLYQWKSGEILRCDTDDRASKGQVIQGLQTHDQVGNHPLGMRVGEIAGPSAQRSAAALTLLYPSIPFIFMGEEFATPSPFCFFVDFGDQWLRDGVISGRKRDYEHHDWKEFISPLEEETFLRSKLPPREAGDELTLNWYRSLLQIRKEWISKGILDENRLTIESDPNLQMVTLRYPGAWVSVRLGEFSSPNDDKGIEVSGEVLLHSARVTPDCKLLRLNEAAVGVTG